MKREIIFVIISLFSGWNYKGKHPKAIARETTGLKGFN